ncbi:MAG: LysM peptidoglycan-binding domain-containing protein [Lachnospiraceae bacterium]|nr:LysM peptidoglycan-binding domain-containing protein [Lachnospiraceae bacterium]
MKKKNTYISVLVGVCACIGILLFGVGYFNTRRDPVSNAAADESTEIALHDIYTVDNRLKLISHETYKPDKESVLPDSDLENSYTRVSKIYDEEGMAKLSHAYFDEYNRLCYVLGYSSGILGDSRSYCEENVYLHNDTEHTCRYIYYKSNSLPYRDGFYIADRYIFGVSDFQFDEEGRLILSLSYSRDVGSDLNGYSEELFFSRGYEAEYDGEYLLDELQYYDFWGTNEFGAWEYGIYQYNDQGDCILKVITTEDEITLYCYEYDENTGRIDEYAYLVTDNWDLSCDDGSIYYFGLHWDEPAVKKVTADGTVEKELFYGRAMNLGQQHYLMPEEVEETVDDHMYTVKQGDCLWNIAYKSYGNGSYYDIIYRVNRSIIGQDENLVMPGMRLYVPEIGNAQDTKIRG